VNANRLPGRWARRPLLCNFHEAAQCGSDDTFGWGVVLSDETLTNLAANDAISAEAIGENFAYWDDIALHFQGQRLVSSGHGFCGIGRQKLLSLLQTTELTMTLL